MKIIHSSLFGTAKLRDQKSYLDLLKAENRICLRDLAGIAIYTFGDLVDGGTYTAGKKRDRPDPEEKSGVVQAQQMAWPVSRFYAENTTAFDMFCVPPDPAGFLPSPRLRKLIQTVNGASLTPQLRRQMLYLFSKNARLFSRPNEIEDESFLRQLMEAIKPGKDFKCLAGLGITYKFSSSGDFQLTDPESRPKSALVWQSWVLIASEAKGIGASIFEALPQGCQIAGDGALMLAAAGLDIEQCVVPGILVAGDCVQFYGAYLLPRQFPCFALLSPPLSTTSREGISTIGRWVAALREFARKTVSYLKNPQLPLCRAPEGIFNCIAPNKGRNRALLDCDLFFKPIRLVCFYDEETLQRGKEETHPYRTALTRALEIYQALFDHEPCREFVNFPIGWLQLPGNEQPELQKAIAQRVRDDNFPEGDTQQWQPYLVFDRLKFFSPELLPRDTLHANLFRRQLKRAFECFRAAEVVHLDVRPANVVWWCSCHSKASVTALAAHAPTSPASGTLSLGETLDPSSVDDDPNHRLTLKVIDWEEAFFTGELLPAHLVEAMQFDPNRRYLFAHYPRKLEVGIEASPLIDTWAVGMIDRFAEEQPQGSWDDFMRDAPSQDSWLQLIDDLTTKA